MGTLLYNSQTKKGTSPFIKYLSIPSNGTTQPYKFGAIHQHLDIKSEFLFACHYDLSGVASIYADNVPNQLYIGKTDTSLNNWQWYRYFGFPDKYIVPYYMLATTDGGCMVTAGVHDTSGNLNWYESLLVLKLDANGVITTISNITPKKNRELTFYPVPVQETLFISYNGAKMYDLYIYDFSGRLVLYRSRQHKRNTSISTTDLPSGTYFYKAIFSDNDVETGKLIK